MNYSNLRHRIIFLKPCCNTINGMNENVTHWISFKPTNKSVDESDVYLSEDDKGNPILTYDSGVLYSHTMALQKYAVWANVAPQTGREYEESQKIRAETTYNINVRYFPGITSDMKIMYGVKVFNIVSVLDINERHTNLKIVAAEVDRNGCQ